MSGLAVSLSAIENRISTAVNNNTQITCCVVIFHIVSLAGPCQLFCATLKRSGMYRKKRTFLLASIHFHSITQLCTNEVKQLIAFSPSACKSAICFT